MEGLDLAGSLNLLVAIFVKILFGLITILSLLMSRQVVLMDRVVNVSIGGTLKSLALGFFLVCLILTTVVVLLV